MRVPSFLSSIPRQWRTPKTILGLFVLELPLTIAALALFGIAQPDLYRTRFWQEGADHGWNSNPNQIIYAIANYRPVKTPLPWSQLLAYFAHQPFRLVTNMAQYYRLQCSDLGPLRLHPPMQRDHVHHIRLPPFAVSFRSRRACRPLCCQHPQPSRT